MAINFPDSPTLNQIAQVGNSSYVWNGNAWIGYTTSFNVNYNASSILIQDDGVVSGASTTINFGNNLSVSYSSGIATITGSASGGGGETLDQTLALGNSSSIGMNVGVLTATSFVRFGGTSTQFLKANGSVDTNTYLTSYTETDTLNSVTSRGNNTANGISVGIATATSFVRSGGTSSQFLKADGSVDSNTYLTSYTETDTLNSVTGRGNSTSNGISVGVLTATRGNFTSINNTGVSTATSFVRTGGTSSEFLKADGSVDSNAYLTTSGSAANLTSLTGVSGGTYGNSTTIPVITVSATGRITSIATIAVSAGGGGGGSSSQWVTTSAGIHTLSSVGIGTTNPTSRLTVSGGVSATDLNVSGISTFNIASVDQFRARSVAERTTVVNGNTVGLAFSTGGGNVAICTNSSGNITLNVTNIPTDSSFDNHSLSFSVIVQQTGTARTCTAINLNGVSRTIRWSGGSLSNAIAGVSTSSGYDIFTFTGINTVGSASTTSNYIILGSVNGGFN